MEIRVPDIWRDHLRAIELNYRRAPFFSLYYEDLTTILHPSSSLLVDLNTRLIEWFMRALRLSDESAALIRIAAGGQEDGTSGEHLYKPGSARLYVTPWRLHIPAW